MIPSPWIGVVLVFAVYRLTRLIGWDDFPLAYKVRAWVIGERWIPIEPIGHIETIERVGNDLRAEGTLTPEGARRLAGFSGEPPSLPGKQPPSEVENVRPAYDRPTLAHLVHCPFCLGWWVSLATYLAWLAWDPVLYGLAPLALSGAVGLLAKNLDA